MSSPIRDGCFFVDNSSIELITTCPWLAYVSIIRRLRPEGESSALRFGGFIHQAMEYRDRLTGLGKDWNENDQIALLTKLFTETPLETEGWRNLDNAVKVIRAYNAFYLKGKEDYTIATNPTTGQPYVEQPFACDTGKTIRGLRIIYTGRIDRKVVMPDASSFIEDHKTSSVLGDTTFADWAISEQFRGYCWADRECTGTEPTGYRINVLGIRESINNAEYDDTLGKVMPLGKSKAVPVEFVRQTTYTQVPKGQLDEWFDNMLQQVDIFLYHRENFTSHGVPFPRHHKHCIGKYGQCPFYNVCSLPAESRENALTSNAYKENTWTPLYIKDTLKHLPIIPPIETKLAHITSI